MADTLKYNYPDVKIDFLVNKRVFELVQDYPNINKVHAIEKDSLKDILSICKENKYDLVIIVRPLFIIALAAFLSRIRYRLGTGYRWYSFLFNLKHYGHRKYSTKHELEYNLDLLGELNCKRINNTAPRLKVEDSLINEVREKIRAKNVDLSKDIIIIHPGSLGSAKTWSTGNFAKLIELLSNDKSCDFNILVTGTKSDDIALNSLVNAVGDKVNVVNNLKLKEFAALCKMAKIFISNSTGPIHIAAAVGTFCVGFYSPVKTESAVRWAPYTDNKMIFTPEVREKAISNNVMDKIDPQKVFEFIKNYFESKKKID